jgi:hypothetical protein
MTEMANSLQELKVPRACNRRALHAIVPMAYANAVDRYLLKETVVLDIPYMMQSIGRIDPQGHTRTTPSGAQVKQLIWKVVQFSSQLGATTQNIVPTPETIRCAMIPRQSAEGALVAYCFRNQRFGASISEYENLPHRPQPEHWILRAAFGVIHK